MLYIKLGMFTGTYELRLWNFFKINLNETEMIVSKTCNKDAKAILRKNESLGDGPLPS